MMLGAQYRRSCVRNVKTLELVLNVVSISGHEAGQKKVSARNQSALEIKSVQFLRRTTGSCLGAFVSPMCLRIETEMAIRRFPSALNQLKENGQDVGEDDHCV
jgi:hypothetical protein